MPVNGMAGPLLVLMVAATFIDIRRREVPIWLALGGIGGGLLAALVSGGWPAFGFSLLGALVGGCLLLPFVWLGGIGLGDALVLAVVGAWGGVPFVLHAAWWAALAGGLIALLVQWRGARTFAYVPALAIGVALALSIGL